MIRLSIHRLKITGLQDNTGALQTSANTACKVTVIGSDGVTLLAATSMTYDSAGVWYYDAPASNFATAKAPWEIVYSVYDNTGVTLRRTFRQVEADEWYAPT